MKKVIRPEDATFPYIVQDGSVGIKISKARNKGRDTYMISYSVAGKRKQVMCADFEKAYAKAKAIGKTVSHGRLNALEISSTDAIRFVEAKKELQPTGVSIEIAAKEYAQAWRLLGGKALLVEAAREYVKRHLDTIPIKTVQESVKEMLETKEREGASHEYRKILRLYLEQLEAFSKPPGLEWWRGGFSGLKAGLKG